MNALRLRITIPESHEITVKLPADLPAGDAELIVLTEDRLPERPDLRAWIESWAEGLPRVEAPTPDALRRERLYE